MRHHPGSRFVPLLGLLLLAGCSKSSNNVTGTGGGSSEQVQVTTAIAATPGVLDDGVSDSQDSTTYSAEPATSGLSAIHPITFWRRWTVSDRTFAFAFSDTDSTGRPLRAVVTISTHLHGTFNVAANVPSTDGNPADSTRQVFHKPLDETRTRLVWLHRAALATDARVVWRISGVSGVHVVSNPNTTHIVSVHLVTTGVDTTIVNPIAFINLATLMRFQPASTVQITVTTSNATDAVAIHLVDGIRFRLHNNGDGTHTGQWTTSVFTHGLRHVGIDAISHGSLFDDTAAYDSEQWVEPFVLFPELLLGPPA